MTLHNTLLSRTSVTLERVTLQSDRAIGDVLDVVDRENSRPSIASAARAWTSASWYEESEDAVRDVARAVWKHSGAVRTADDTVARLSAPYEDERGLAVARELAGHVLSVLPAAAGVNP